LWSRDQSGNRDQARRKDPCHSATVRRVIP
jgi:hypothetical protein